MSPTSTHSIWLVPDRAGPTFARLRRLVEALAARSGGDVFDPHVTLVGSLAGEPSDLVARTRRLAARLAPYEITLGPAVARALDPNRFRRLFSAVDPTPAVMAANAAARRAFSLRDGAAYEPHLSLAYADVDAAAFEALRAAADDAGVIGSGFSVASLELWRTDGVVAGWRRAAAFPLKPLARAH